MDGSILGFDEETNKGAIRTENGDRYAFTLEMFDAVKCFHAFCMFLLKPHVAGSGLIFLGWLFA